MAYEDTREEGPGRIPYERFSIILEFKFDGNNGFQSHLHIHPNIQDNMLRIVKEQSEKHPDDPFDVIIGLRHGDIELYCANEEDRKHGVRPLDDSTGSHVQSA